MIVRVNNIKKTFNGTKALDGISFAVERGETVGILGPNGAGKTTVIQIMLGLLTPTSGSIELFGMNLEKQRVAILKRSNFSSAYTNLPHNLTVWENLMIFSELYEVADSRRKAKELLAMFEIDDLANKITGQLSSGESTRVNLCKALLNDPELLLLDEPTASLDPDIADKVRKLLRKTQAERNITLINTSHNMLDIQEVCDRVLFLHKGRIIAEGSPEAILAQFEESSLEQVFIRIARSGELKEVG
jgi:ABC-2 type transport system ATP-binding protein